MRSLRTKKRRDAQRMATALEEQLNRPSKPELDRLDWQQAWDLYELYFAPTIHRNTLMYRESTWREFWTWAASLPIAYIDEVTPEIVLRWRAQLMALETKKLTEGTINAKLQKCQTIISKLSHIGVYDGSNPFSRIDHLKEHESQRDYLADGEIDLFLQKARELDPHLELYCALGVYAGLRLPGEGLGARWSWVHFQPEGRGGYIRIPKTDTNFSVKDREARTIPLAHQLADILRPHRGIGDAYIVHPECMPEPGLTRPRVGFRKEMAGLRYLIPGKNITPYSMRHTFASRCVQMGVPEFKIMKWMGHTSLRMLQRYAHLAPQDDDINIAFPSRPAGNAVDEGG